MVYEGIAKTSDIVGHYVSVISSKKELLFKQVINVVLVFVILLVFGCLDFATLSFHYEYLLKISFWTTIITKTIAGVCSLNIGINLMYDMETKKDVVLADNIYRYENLNRYKDNDFDYYIEQVYNKAVKIRNYISSINLKIYKLNKKSKPKDRVLYSSSTATEEEKARNKYCVARKELEELKTDEYIAKNLDSLDVKYEKVDASIFELEIDGSQKIEKTKVRGSVGFGRMRVSFSVVLGTVLISTLTTSFALEADKEQFESEVVAAAHYCLKAVSDIGVVLWQLLNGMLKTRGIVTSQLTIPFANRVKILMGYFAWREQKGKSVPEFYKSLLQENKDYVEVEMTEEQLKKIQGEQ